MSTPQQPRYGQAEYGAISTTADPSQADTPQFGRQQFGAGEFPATRRWRIDGRGVRLTRLRESPYRRDLTFEVARSTLAAWREYDQPGDFEEIARADGGVEISPTGGTRVTVAPPSDRSPPFDTISDGLVAGYAEEQLSPTRVQISLSVRRPQPRTPRFGAEQQSGAFELTTARGRLGLSSARVAPSPVRGAAAGRTADLTLRLTPQQAALLCDEMATPGAIIARTVPDAADIYQDISGGAQTLSITTPPDATLASGAWGVRGWELEPLTEQRQARYQMTLELVRL